MYIVFLYWYLFLLTLSKEGATYFVEDTTVARIDIEHCFPSSVLTFSLPNPITQLDSY